MEIDLYADPITLPAACLLWLETPYGVLLPIIRRTAMSDAAWCVKSDDLAPFLEPA